MKTVIFIDGENFMHQVRDVLYKRRIVRNRDELTNYDIRALLGRALKELPDFDATRGKVLYYSTKVHISDQSESLKERTEAIKLWSDKLKEQLVQQCVEFVEAGHLLVREGKRCVECGHREPVLMEKGVDVQLATDLIRTSGDNVRLILLSSDGDLTPAVVEARRRGSEIIYVGFRGVSNATLGRAAGQRYTINANQVVEVYKQNATPGRHSVPEGRKPTPGTESREDKTSKHRSGLDSRLRGNDESGARIDESMDQNDHVQPQSPKGKRT